MGEIQVGDGLRCLRDFLQTFGGPLVTGDGFQKVAFRDADFLTSQAGSREVLHVVKSEDLQFRFFSALDIGLAVPGGVGQGFVWNNLYRRLGPAGDLPDIFISLITDQAPVLLNGFYEMRELLHIVVECGKNIHVVPRDACQYGDVRTIVMELGAQIDRGRQVLVPFENSYFAGLAQVDHGVEAVQQGADHIIELHAAFFEYVHDHGGRGGFAVASSDDDPRFVFGLFIQIFRITVNAHAQFPGPDQFRIVFSGMHSQYDGVQVRRDFFRIPSPSGRKESGLFQSAAGWLENLVVRAAYFISFFV